MSKILHDFSSKSQGSEGGEGRKGEREERRKGGEERQKKKKNAETGNKSNINLKLSNFRYHRNCFRDFSSKLQTNAAKSTCD